MDIKTLRYFTTVAQLQNVSKAASILNVSQSSLSKQIAGLEMELGVRLFDRNGKSIRLNSSGMKFYDSCSRILSEFSAAEEELRLAGRTDERLIRIGTSGTPDSLLKALSGFADLYPETEFVISSDVEEKYNLNINDYDVMLIPDDPKFDYLSGYTLYTDSYYYAVREGVPDASAVAFSPEMLTHQPVVFIRNSDMASEYPCMLCSALGWDTGTSYYVDTRDMHRRMISSGNAAGFVPKSLLEGYKKDSGIRFIPVLSSRFTRDMKICFLREKHLSPLGLKFRSYLLDYYDLEK